MHCFLLHSPYSTGSWNHSTYKVKALQKHVTLIVYFLCFGLDKSRSLLSRPLARQLSMNYLVDTGFLYNKVAMIRHKMKSRAGCLRTKPVSRHKSRISLGSIYGKYLCKSESDILKRIYSQIVRYSNMEILRSD